jgi:hypothetical protein
MKPYRTVALAAFVLAALAPFALALAVPAPAADASPFAAPVETAAGFGTDLASDLTTDLNSDFDQRCLNFCSRVLCVDPQTCGSYTNPSGGRSCGCH